MKIDKIKLCVLESLLLGILILALFESNIFTRIVISVVILIFAILFKIFFPKKEKISIYSKQVLYLCIAFAFLYLALFYASGFYFGFYKAIYRFNLYTLSRYIIPIAVTIISSEVIRFSVISERSKFGNILMYIIMVLIDVRLYIGLLDITVLEELLMVIGYIIFSSMSTNLLYNYMSKRFGIVPIIGYRLIVSLYSYIIPIIPDMIVFFQSLGRMIYPFILYLVLDNAYGKSVKVATYQGRGKRVVFTVITMIFMAGIAMLISCRFTYCSIVIGSGSMTGTINKGDVIIYKAYNNEKIEKDDIIVFKQKDIKIVHRVIDTEMANGEQIIYTKGDANPNEDNWELTKSDIVGFYKFRLKYAGYPTLWVSELFN